MRAGRPLLAALLLLTAVALQAAVVARLPVPGGPPELPLLVVLALALERAPADAAVLGFAGGLLVDLAPPADHAAGRVALAYAVAALVVGRLGSDARRSSFGPPLLVLGGAAVAAAVGVGLAALLGDPRLSLGSALGGPLVSAFYDGLAAPFVVPLVLALDHRATPEAVRR